MREQQIKTSRPAFRGAPDGGLAGKLVFLFSIALLTGVFLLIPSIRGFSLSAEQEAQAPGVAQHEARLLASEEVLRYIDDPAANSAASAGRNGG